jgi:AraC-like DNA-binding protein
MLIASAPGALLWPAALIVWGPGSVSAGHSHHCVQLVMALSGTLRVRGVSEKRWRRCAAALVRPDSGHEVDARDVPVLLAFVEPESELGAALVEKIEADVACVPDAEVARWRSAVGADAAMDPAKVERWVRSDLLKEQRPTRLDPRVRRALAYLRDNLDTADELSLPALAEVAGLSPSRFMHLFTKSLGVPLRPYLLWLRLQRAAGELMKGSTITRAAHEAGFADAAHLTRTFRRMLGTTPSEIAARKTENRRVAVG